jgi:phosphatidate cytidylyltransferase
MLKKRILTACLLIPITVAALFYLTPPWFMIVITLILLGGAWEWSNFMSLKRIPARLLFVFLVLFAFMDVIYVSFILHDQVQSAMPFLIPGAIWWFLATLMVLFYPRGCSWWNKSVLLRGLMGLMVLVPCWISLNFIRNQYNGTYTLLFLFILIWGADSAAYFVGKKWGKTKLAPDVSPGKSVQGLIGALLFSVVAAVIVLWTSHAALRIWPWVILLSLVTIVFSVVGDLFESMLKRQAGLKDSGQLLPGHGGLLDRIDSLTAAAPIFALGLLLLGQMVN